MVGSSYYVGEEGGQDMLWMEGEVGLKGYIQLKDQEPFNVGGPY
jgi:hypothetical protein